MNILFLTAGIPITDRANRTKNIAVALSNDKNKVSIINVDWSKSYPKKQKVNGIKIENIWFSRKKNKIKQSIRLITNLYKKIAKRTRNKSFEVIQCENPLFLPISIYLGRLKNSKVVYDSYEDYPKLFARNIDFLSTLIENIYKKVENNLLRFTDLVLTVDTKNNYLENRFKEYNDSVVVLFNVPNLKNIARSDKKTLEKLKKKYRKKRIISYIGGINPQKGAYKMIKSVNKIKKRFSNINLLLMGKHRDRKVKRKIQRYIKKNNLKENVKYLGWLSEKEMLQYLEVAEIGLALHQPTEFYRTYPSKGTGRKFFTYMQAGLPIIGPKFGEVGQVVREENCGILVDTTEPQEIAQAITELLNNKKKAEEMGKLGREAIEEKYNWEKEKKKLLKAYQNIE